MKQAQRITARPDYQMIAEHAAEHERHCDYDLAAKLWVEAAKQAVNRTNQYWAESRSEFCHMRQRRTPG